jgi:hypothetical protein
MGHPVPEHVERTQDVDREHASEHLGRVVGDPGDIAADPALLNSTSIRP